MEGKTQVKAGSIPAVNLSKASVQRSIGEGLSNGDPVTVTMEAKIKAIAPWFGGKRTLAPRIVAELGEHRQYFEPFCGSMAVLFSKPECQKETVNDLHGHLINLALVLQHPDLAPRLYERLDRTLMCEGIFDEAAERYDDNFLSLEPDLSAAYWYFVVSWMGRNGIAGTRFGKRGANHAFAVRWTDNGGSPTVRFDSAVGSIPAWHRRLKNVVILRRDALEILDRPDDVKTTAIYVDPPYVADTRSGFTGSGGHSRYVHEFSHGASDGLFAADDDHTELAEILRKFKHARIVVSYYDCDRVRELYDGWTFVSHARQKNLNAPGGRGERSKEAPEVLIINGPSYSS